MQEAHGAKQLDHNVNRSVRNSIVWLLLLDLPKLVSTYRAGIGVALTYDGT